MLMRLFVRGGRIIPLMGLAPILGDPGGELAMALWDLMLRQNVVICCENRESQILYGDGREDRSQISVMRWSRSRDARCFDDAGRRIAREG